MFVYQTVIMAIAILLMAMLAYIFKIKNRAVLAVSILAIAVAGAGVICAVQNYFGTHFYDQKFSLKLVGELKFSQEQKDRVDKIFSDYKIVAVDSSECQNAIEKTYRINGKDVASTVKTDIYVYQTKSAADSVFSLNQKLYESKYLPIDYTRSQLSGTLEHRYLTSIIKSEYKSNMDVLYLPSKISCISTLTVQDGNVIVTMVERSDRAVTNKGAVLQDIVSRLKESQ